MLTMTRRKMKVPYSAKIPGRSVPQVTGIFENEVTRQGNELGLKFFGAKVTSEAIANAIVLHFLDMSQPDRDRILAEYVRKFEAMIAIEGIPEREPDVIVPDTASHPRSKKRGA